MAALARLHHADGTDDAEASIGEGSEPVSQSTQDRVSPTTGQAA
jgi:hypothetical protein